MTTNSSPRQVARRLNQNSEKMADASVQQTMLDGAETIEYLLLLLKECASYIEDVKEYDRPPRFIKAVREALS